MFFFVLCFKNEKKSNVLSVSRPAVFQQNVCDNLPTNQLSEKLSANSYTYWILKKFNRRKEGVAVITVSGLIHHSPQPPHFFCVLANARLWTGYSCVYLTAWQYLPFYVVYQPCSFCFVRISNSWIQNLYYIKLVNLSVFFVQSKYAVLKVNCPLQTKQPTFKNLKHWMAYLTLFFVFNSLSPRAPAVYMFNFWLAVSFVGK